MDDPDRNAKTSPDVLESDTNKDYHDNEAPPIVGNLIDVENCPILVDKSSDIPAPVASLTTNISHCVTSPTPDHIPITDTNKSPQEKVHDEIKIDKETQDLTATLSETTLEEKIDYKARCIDLQKELNKLRNEKTDSEKVLIKLKAEIESSRIELEREVQKRVDLEQRFTEEAKRATDQIEELIANSDCDDAKLTELRRRFDLYTRETSTMIENFTTNRELLASQLTELRKENDYLLGKYLSKARDLQSAEIDLPQNVEELQFHCLTLNEKLILATMAKERLEETLVQSTSTLKSTTAVPASSSNPATTMS